VDGEGHSEDVLMRDFFGESVALIASEDVDSAKFRNRMLVYLRKDNISMLLDFSTAA
jgi:hypothetical protein